MSISKDIIVDALRIRYDSYSAETIFELACQRAQLEGKTSFDGKELAAFRTALEKVGDRVGGVLARLDDLSGAPAPAPAPTKDAKHDSKPNEAKDKSDGKPEKAAEAKADSKPNDAKPVEAKDKSDSKPNEKSADKSDSKPHDKPAEAKP